MANGAKILLIGGAVGIIAYLATRQQSTGSGENYFSYVTDTVQDLASDLTGGFLMKVGSMKFVTAADLNNENVQAFLKVIRRGEGTSDLNGYRRIFGGQLFTGYADHPRITVKKSGYTSSAAGAYQFIISTWDETKRIMGLKDFTPASQDLAAVGRIAARGALDDVKAGRFELAIKKTAREWASLPFSPYGQPVISYATAANVYTTNGGTINNEGMTA